MDAVIKQMVKYIEDENEESAIELLLENMGHVGDNIIRDLVIEGMTGYGQPDTVKEWCEDNID